MYKRIKLTGAIITALLIILTAGCANPSDNSGDAVARVNGMDISASDVRIHLTQAEEIVTWGFMMDNVQPTDEALSRATREEAVRLAAFFKLTDERARGLGVELTDHEQGMIDDEINSLIEDFGQEELDEMLQADGFRDKHHLAEFYTSHLLLDSLVYTIASIPEEFSQFEQYMEDEEEMVDLLGAMHILAGFGHFDSEEEAEDFANEMLARANAGEDFAMLVREYGQDPGMDDFVNGYSFTSGDMVPEFEQATRELEIGAISGLVHSSFGIHIIKRVEPDINEWHRLRNTQPRSLEDRMRAAVFRGLEALVDYAEIEFLPALDDAFDN